MTDDATDVSGGDAGPPRTGAWRVTFEFRGGRVRVLSQERVNTLAPPDDSDAVARAAAGHWVEVRDADGASTYCQVVNVPLADQPEVFSPDEPLRRIEVEDPVGYAQVLVPDDPAGYEIVLHGRAASAEVSQRAARQLVRSVLREKRQEDS